MGYGVTDEADVATADYPLMQQETLKGWLHVFLQLVLWFHGLFLQKLLIITWQLGDLHLIY